MSPWLVTPRAVAGPLVCQCLEQQQELRVVVFSVWTVRAANCRQSPESRGPESNVEGSDRHPDRNPPVNHNAPVKQRVREFHRRNPGPDLPYSDLDPTLGLDRIQGERSAQAQQSRRQLSDFETYCNNRRTRNPGSPIQRVDLRSQYLEVVRHRGGRARQHADESRLILFGFGAQFRARIGRASLFVRRLFGATPRENPTNATASGVLR